MPTPPPFPDIQIVGMHFREKEGTPAKSIVANFIPPVELNFEREPGNEFDSNAIKVFYQGDHIGYVERGKAIFWAHWLDKGYAYRLIVKDLHSRQRNLYPIADAIPLEAEEAADERQLEASL